MRHLVIDVQVLMIASGVSDPPDDGTGLELLKAVRDVKEGRLVWDDGGKIKSQYEQKLGEQTFARLWIEELVLSEKVVEVARRKLTKKESLSIRETGLIGEDLNFYVRTTANSPDGRLVSHDKHYDNATCRALKKQLGIKVHSAKTATEFVRSD
jgi:hypothetical protein